MSNEQSGKALARLVKTMTTLDKSGLHGDPLNLDFGLAPLGINVIQATVTLVTKPSFSIFGPLPRKLGEIGFGTIGRQVEQLRATLPVANVRAIRSR